MKGTITVQNLTEKLDARMRAELSIASSLSDEQRMLHQWKAAGLAEAIQILGQMAKENKGDNK